MKTMKKITALVLTLMMLLGSLAAGTVTASADYSGNCGDGLAWTLSDEGKLTISGTGKMEDYNGGDCLPGWYDYAEDITSVIIENGVASIGDFAFFLFSSLKSITIPSSVASIGDGAFVACASLSEIKVDSGNNSFCAVDGVLFSKDKKTLICYPAGKQGTSYTIPSSVTNIGMGAFCECESLTSVTIPSSVTSIGDWAFEYCSSLASITIPSSVTSIGDGAFDSCDSLTSIIIPPSVTSFGDGAFAYCISLTSITIPSSVTIIGDRVFEECSNNLVINCVPGSFADDYAKENNIKTNYACDVMPDSIGTEPSAYKVDVTVSVPVNAPAGTEVWIDGSKAGGSNGRYSMHIGQLESDKNITVQIKYGTTVLETSSVKVTVDGGFFAKIASFFSNFLFNGFKWKTDTINF